MEWLKRVNNKPLLYDVFSGAGGAARGYQQAGFFVVGIDNKPQPRYIGDAFYQMDALEFLEQVAKGLWPEPAVIHASPPCQLDSVMTPIKSRDNHPDLIAPTRDALLKTGKVFAIENVNGARFKLSNSIMLCGSMFGLPIWRHRRFEIWPARLILTPPCRHDFKPVLITDNGGPNANGWGKPRRHTPISVKQQAIEISWMTGREITEAIPPAYTKWLGEQLLLCLNEKP